MREHLAIIGVVTAFAGVALRLLARYRPGTRSPWLNTLGTGVVALGIAAIALTREGLWWSISSICFAVVAIVLIASALWRMTR
ncbi:MAG TPA: hypothetical protein VFK13_03520 [Gemmatimonadaceae bacterium]|nr:hypothetical protein [Gemmatimonadaceae bacterium]